MEDNENLEKLIQMVVAGIVVGVLGFIFTIAAVALFGPHLQDFLKGLPWGVG